MNLAPSVLLVEDQTELRRICRRALEGAGYHVSEAASAEEALDLMSDNRHIHLLLTDLIMDRMTGAELERVLRPDHPSMRVVFMTGLSSEEARRQGVVGSTVLDKPFTLRQLRDVVAAALAS